MSRFATNKAARSTTRQPDTVNRTGAPAYEQSDKMKLASILLTSFVQDQYYRSASGTVSELDVLLGKVDPIFAAKAAIYARNEFGMRSISHVVGASVPARVKGEQWTKDFVEKVVRRPDDATEILAYYLSNFGKPVPNSLKKGLGKALGKFDAYQLAKYRGEGNAVSLVDVVNLCRPVPTAKNGKALEQLVKGTLRSEGTFEQKLSAAGQKENKEAAKAEAWGDLILSGKIGQMALLKNLRNIEEQATPEVRARAYELLTNPKRVKESLILPFRYATAAREVSEMDTLKALNKAVDLACDNVPKLSGTTLIAVDHSGSMGWDPDSDEYRSYGYGIAPAGQRSPVDIGNLFAAILVKALGADVMVFGSTAGYVKGLNSDDSVLTIKKRIASANFGHATNFPAVLQGATKAYDRVITLSDMQSYIGVASDARKDYEQKYGKIQYYNFDLAGLGTTIFKERTYEIAGFSEKVFDIMEKVEQDPQALITAIEAVEL